MICFYPKGEFESQKIFQNNMESNWSWINSKWYNIEQIDSSFIMENIKTFFRLNIDGIERMYISYGTLRFLQSDILLFCVWRPKKKPGKPTVSLIFHELPQSLYL